MYRIISLSQYISIPHTYSSDTEFNEMQYFSRISCTCILTQYKIIRGERFGKARVNYGPQRSVVHEQNFEEN